MECWEWQAGRRERPSVRRWTGEPFAELSRALAAAAMPRELRVRMAWPFVGGALGYVAYDAGWFLERLPDLAEADSPLPELCLMFMQAVLAHDHARGETVLFTLVRGESETEAERESLQLRAAMLELLQRPAPARAERAAPTELRSHVDEAAYSKIVNGARERIMNGDAFEVCTAHRLECAFDGDELALYGALRRISPAAFACHVRTPWGSLLSSSPERFLRLDRDGAVESRPIKGTRPRGATPEDDERLRRELETSEKDRAENVMIVDLVRNDLGRVCDVGSISVPELQIVETHPRVFQMVSTVRGRLAAGEDAVSLFRASFPPGSMTGAPKIEAMKIIDSLERYKRGLYAGAVGYFDVGGGMDFSVVIRSFVLSGGRCTVGVGGAIVADSDPAAEYRETMDKARALIEALAAVSAA
jgi:aminodeoxychorismate synthase component I